ncbi:MAG: hypothetical protein CMB37_05080 [Euryarchaeota archaeon]|nr:hypothetical protein [Euryarchaeota archaeon]
MATRTRMLSLSMIGLMLFSTTLVHAATISTFANGNNDVDVELRNQGTWGDDLTAGISLPTGETVDSAGLIIGTSYATHNNVQTIDSSIVPGGEIWNPIYNGAMTQYSATSDFTYEETYLKLTSMGYNADFEGTQEGWTAGADQGVPPQVTNWQLGSDENNQLPYGCEIGEWCWGTDFEGVDYTMDLNSGEYNLVLTSASFFVHPGKSDMSFRSFHSLVYRAVGTNQYYYDDCAYVAVQNSTNNADWNNARFSPFDVQATTGLSSGDGLYQLGSSTNQVPTSQCDYLGSNGPQTGDYVLGGNGTTASNSPQGWSEIKLDLSAHAGRYVKLNFIMEVNDLNGAAPFEMMNAGWYIDGVRVGDPLPAQGSVTMRSFAPQASGQQGFPDGYGLLHLDLEKSASADFGVDILDASNGNVVVDRNGNSMSNLQGSTIELWDIDASTYPLIDFKFTYGSGAARLASPVLNAFHLGTMIGTSFNSTNGFFFEGGMYDGSKWYSDMTGGSQVFITPARIDTSFPGALPVERYDLSMPIVAVKPMVTDNCGGPDILFGMSMNEEDSMVSMNNNQWIDVEPTYSFAVGANYTSFCEVTEFYAELKFAHHSRGITLDVAGDGDIEWGVTDEAFGRFGRQDMFRSGVVNGINEGDTHRTIAVDVNQHGEGAPFLLPRDASVSYAHIGYENNNLDTFDLSIISGSEEVSIGEIQEGVNAPPTPFSPLVSIQDDLQTLLDNPLVPTAWIDEYGNSWCLFRLSVDSATATGGSTITFRDLEIIYTWETALGPSHNIARELNQGVALGMQAGPELQSVVVPMTIVGGSGGAVNLNSLSISTTPGYDSTLDANGITGMYPNGDVIEIITTHDVSSSTGESLGGASLLFETSNGNMELRWDQMNGSFWEEYDDDDKINFRSMQSISSTLAGSTTVQLNWRFTVNADWDDTPSVRIYAATLSASGVNGLPAGILIQPPNGGNAVENDAGITDFHLYNQGGVEQIDLNNAYSSNTITLDFNIRYEDLPIAPNPSSYQVLLQKRNQSNLQFEEWLFVDSTAATIDGDYSWQPGLPVTEAGNEQYRLLMENYTDGDTICPPAEYNPDSDCAIRFSITLDPFAPHLMNISVYSQQGDWRDLDDDTWVRASNNQVFRIAAQDLPLAPEFLTFNYWVEAEDDCGLDGLCPGSPSYTAPDEGELDRIPQLNEYESIALVRETAADTSYYTIDHPCGCISDYANSGIDPPQMVSVFVSGSDIGGNPIDGGSFGVNQDLVTYIAMESRVPSIEAFRISDSSGAMLNENNRSVYAGNVYHLLVDGKDDNGWRDVETIRVTMNPSISSPSSNFYDPDGSIVIHYSPQNDTAWTDSNWLEIIDDYENVGLKPTMLTRNGETLFSPFEQRFTLDIPIRMAWSIPLAYVGGVITPDIAIKDKDPNNNEVFISASRNPQRWSYASGIELDTMSFTVEDTSGFPTVGVGSQDGGFVYQGDILVIDGRYVFSSGVNDLVFVKPELELTLRLTRTPLYPGGLPTSGYSPAITTVEEYIFENGSFNIVTPAAYATNEYTYTMELLGLPQGAVDNTPASDRTFIVKVDASPPSLVFGSWELSNSITGDTLEGSISSSEMNCLDAEVFINEKQGMDTESVNLNWMFFEVNPSMNNYESNWTEYLTAFEGSDWTGWESAPMYIPPGSQGDIRATSTCVNLWNNTQPIPSEMENIIVKFWLTGYDSSGQPISGAGEFGDSIYSGEGTYNLDYESAKFDITRVDLSVDKPMAESDFDLLIDFVNNGNKEGVLEIQIVTWIGDQPNSPVTYTYPEEPVQPGEDTRWRISMDQFPNPANNVRYVVLDMDGEEIASVDPFNVAKYSEAEQGGDMVLIIGIAAVVILLVIAVVVVLLVLNKGVEDEEIEYIEEEDFLPAGQAVTPMRSQGPPATRPGERRGPPGAKRGPPAASKSPMDIAKEKFPFWDEATIQSYFDQGWNVDQLEEWLASQDN